MIYAASSVCLACLHIGVTDAVGSPGVRRDQLSCLLTLQ